ncbi:MAG: hypothetical protein IJY99_00955 [Alphaproteobacteria bacterium]|nr:hypothetical protein [Alphaproteobacteria bacterium]
MKVKNIAFSGFMAAILMGAVATPADAVSVASKEYVDARETAINTNLTQTYLTKTDAGNTYVTQEAAKDFQKSADALTSEDVQNAITGAVTDNEALAGALAGKEDTTNKVNEITEENKSDTTKYPSLKAISGYVTKIAQGEIGTLGKLASMNEITDDEVADGANIAQSKIAGLTDLATQVGTNTTAIGTLNGGVGTTGSVANTIAQALADGGQIDVALDGKQDKLSDGQISAIAQVATNTQSIADNAADIAQNAQDIADNAGAIAKNAEDIADKADKATTLTGYGITDAYTMTQTDNLLGGKVNATGQTANQIMVTDDEGNVVTAATISASQVDALNKLATASLPEVCTNDDGTLCALTVDKQGKYAWTVIVEPVNP